MSDNKFILQLKGTQTPKSVVEIKNDKLVAPFTGVPHSTDVVGSIIDDKDSSVVVAKGAQNWKLDGSSLVVASSLSGDGADYTGEFNVSGSGLWINATYSLPATIFSAGTKWALKLCGKNLLTTSGQTIGFTLVVKIGNTHITSKTFTVAEGANVFCRQLVIDFSESEQAIIKAQSGDSLTVQLLCSDTNASATIYNGMTVFTALQRRVDGDAVASDTKTFEELEAISDAHISNKNNPHQVTKAQVGLGNVDNTSDLNKPVSTATQNALDDITDLIPAQATTTNQLADKGFVNSSIATNTANFIGTFNSVAELEAYSGTVTNNDYAFVVGTDSAGNTTYNRYKYNGNTQQWVYEYTLNNSSFTAAQWASINSGVTTSDVLKARSAVQPSDLGNGTITITQGGTTKGSFTTNQGNNTTIDIDAGGGGSGLNVGDTFLTTRTDNELNGAVECDGATYNTTDFTGAQAIGALLQAGKVPYVSLAQYASLLSTNGSVGVFGWDGVGTTAFRVPSLNDIFIETGTAAQVGDYLSAGLPNITGQLTGIQQLNPTATGAFSVDSATARDTGITHSGGGVMTIGISAQRSSSIYGNSSTVQPNAVRYRAMVQLAVSATDEALETCTSVLADVAGLKSHEVIGFQAPTADNNYTWYRKYADGWVEQGGQTESSAGNVAKNITFPIEMANTNYVVQVTICGHLPFGSPGNNPGVKDTNTTTGMAIYSGNTGALYWEVKGMAA